VFRDLHNVAEFLTLRRNTALLLLALVVAGLGERLWLAFAPKYLEVLGAGVLIIGFFDAQQTLLGAVYAYPGGWLTDRLGQRRALLLFGCISLFGYVLVLVWTHWLALIVGALFFLAYGALSLPATFTVVATSLDAHKHTMGIGVQSLVRRVPMMLGPALGGWLISEFGWRLGLRYALALCIALNALTLLVQAFMTDPNPERPAARTRAPAFIDVLRSFSPNLRELLLSEILLRFCERLP
jgi:MFS family permease